MPVATARSSSRIAARLVLAWLLAAVAALVVALAALEIDPVASLEAGATNLRRLRPFWLASAALWTALTVVWWRLARDPSGGLVDVGGGRWGAVVLIVLVAAGARTAVLITHEPALSDDIYRYVLDGRNLAHGVNPYLVVPEDRRTAPERWPGEREIAGLVNNAEMYSVYLPTSQWMFGAMAELSPAAVDARRAARFFRSGLVGFEMIAVVLLLVVLHRTGRSPWWAALYAWHPLAISEIAGSGHQESIGLAFMMAALTAWTVRPRRVGLWTVPLATASLVKPMVIPLAAPMLRGQSWRRWLASGVLGFVTCAVISTPLWLTDGGQPLANLRETASRFTLKWAHFGSVYEPLLSLIERLTPAWTNDPQEQLARVLCGLVALATIVLVIVRVRSPWRAGTWILLAMVLLAPVAHPWYLLWALILLPMAGGRAVWVASLTLPWGYVAWRYQSLPDGGVGWGVPPWIMLLSYAPVYAALVWDVVRPTSGHDDDRERITAAQEDTGP